MRKFTIWLLMLFAFASANAQVVIQQSFSTTTTPTGWSLGGGSITSTQSCLTNSWRRNVYNADSDGPSLVTETQVSSGDDLTIAFDYKLVNWSAATVATDPYDGSITTEISLDNGATWSVIAGVIDGTNHLPANTCATVNYVVPGASVPNGSQIKVRWNNSWVSGDYYVYLDNISITQPITNAPACTSVTSPANGAVNVANTALTWPAATGGPSGYKLTIGTTAGGSDILNNSDLGNVLSSPAFNFQPNTTYYVKVVPYNAIGDAVGCTETSFTTCATTTSFSQNFDALTTPAIPACWFKVSSTGSATTQTGSPSSSPNTLYFYGSSAANISVLRLEPVSNLGAGTHRLRMKMRANFTAGGVVEIGYLTNPVDHTTFVSLGSVIASSTTYSDYFFAPATGTYSPFLALRHTGVPANSLLIDDVNWEAIPSCGEPSALTATATSPFAVNLSWTSPVTAPSGGYEYVFSTSNTAPTGAGTAELTTGVSVASLTPNTTYYLFVRGMCGVDGNSIWIGPAAVTTPCAPVTAPTAVETFENSTASLPAACWSEGTGALTASTTLTGTTSSWTTVTGFGNTGTNRAMRINLYGTGSNWFVSNEIDLGTGNQFRVKYDFAVTSYLGVLAQSTLGSHKVDVVVSTDGGLTWSNANIIKSYTGSGTYSATGQTDYAYLSGYSGLVKIGFLSTTSSTTPDIDFHVDNFSVELVPAPEVVSYTSSASCGTSTNLVVTGTELLGATLTIGGTPITITSNTATQITATISTPVSGTLSVTTPGGTDDAATAFSFTNSPAFALSSASTTICEGEISAPITIATGGSDYTSFVWTPAANVTGDAASGWSFNPSSSGVYTVEASNASGCVNTAVVNVNVNLLPISITLSENAITACEGETSIEVSAFAAQATVSNYTQTTSVGSAVTLLGSAELIFNATIPALPNGAVVTSTDLVFDGVTTTGGTWISEIDVEMTGASAIAISELADIDAGATDGGPYTLNGSLVANTGGAVQVTLTNTYTGDVSFATIDVIVNYTLPDTANVTWWTAATGGTQLSANDTIELIGTSVLPTAIGGTYSFFVQADNSGCASSPREEVVVTINSNTTSVVTETACGSFDFGGTNYTNSGTYTVVIPNAAGCDSTITLNLTINDGSDPVIVSADQTICEGELFEAFTANLDVPATDSLIIVGVLDGPLPGGLPKLIELYAIHSIPDLSIYGVGSASNGGGTDGVEFTFPAGSSATAGQFIRISGDSTNLFSFLGVYPQYTENTASNNNGNDAVELFKNGVVIDVFGQIDVSGTGTPWEYLDSWAYRNSGSVPNGGVFDVSEWSFGGVDVFDGTTQNSQAANPYPLNQYSSNTDLGTVTWYSDAALSTVVGTGTSFTPSNTTVGTAVYYVVHNNTGCDSDPVLVNATINATPVAPSVTADGTTDICVDGEVTITSSEAMGITWSNDSTDVSITVSAEGDYFLTYVDANGCSVNSDTITVSIIDVAVPVITASGSLTICEGNEVTLTSSVASNIEWSTGATTASIDVNTAQTITVTVTENGCSATSDEVVVIVEAAPSADATVSNGITIVATPAGMSYQWIDCDNMNTPIAGATSASFTAVENGNYAVIVTNAAGCSDTSECVNVNEVGVSSLEKSIQVDIFPNPTASNVTLAMSSDKAVNVTVFDAQGKVVSIIDNAQNGSIIGLQHVENGVYMVQVSNETGSKVFRVVKQ